LAVASLGALAGLAGRTCDRFSQCRDGTQKKLKKAFALPLSLCNLRVAACAVSDI
jgi:hypothetical protein